MTAIYYKSDLNYLQEWERTWDMEFNPSKCPVLHISRARQPIHSQYTLHGEILESVDCACYLGVSISTDRSWNTHISQIASKVNRTLGFMKRYVRTKNQSVKELAYKNLRQTSDWVCFRRVESLHETKRTKARNGAKEDRRWVSNSYSYYDSVSAMLSNLGWRPLEYRHYKIQYGLVALSMPSYFENHSPHAFP